VLDLNNPETNGRLAYIFIQRIVELSKQKFSSNVIEKCMALAPNQILEPILIAVKECSEEIKATQLGKKIYAKLANNYSSLY
jgi:hypothetical protein